MRSFGETSKGADGVGGSQLNTCAYEQYLDKPEVIHAYREQQLIQAPEFIPLSEHGAVEGRFRPRSLDDVRAAAVPAECLYSSLIWHTTAVIITGRHRHFRYNPVLS